jgi:type I restriction enzyme R subunit
MYNTIAETNNFIVLDQYTKYTEFNEAPTAYQTEAALERTDTRFTKSRLRVPL